jgi:hypothetical protein
MIRKAMTQDEWDRFFLSSNPKERSQQERLIDVQKDVLRKGENSEFVKDSSKIQEFVSAVPVRVQRKRTKGWKMPENTVYVGRPSKFGNKFYAEELGRSIAITLYRKSLERRLLKEPQFLEPLRGKNLACFCPLTDKDGKPVPCHVDVLLEFANRKAPSRRMGIYVLSTKECGCLVKEYTGGKVVTEGCRLHPTTIHFVCSATNCGARFSVEKVFQEHKWSHAY